MLNVRWYLKYPLSYRNLSEMMLDRGLKVAHSTICHWVHTYSPEIARRTRRYLKLTNDSWRVDETYIKVNGEAISIFHQLLLYQLLLHKITQL